MMLHVGQFNLPPRERYEAAMRDIFERRYYTNQGPLVRAFEQRLQACLGVKHAICVTNATIGLMMASEALGVSGRVIVPAVGNATLANALRWCRVNPVFVDVDPLDGQFAVDAVAKCLDDSEPVSALIGSNLWGNACDASAIVELARAHRLPVMFDSSHAFGCVASGRYVGGFGDAEVISFDAEDVINAAGGACVTTGDDEIAARLRNIRSSYGAGRPVPVVKTSNGRMSEAQAALGLISLDDYEANRARNRSLADAYGGALAGTPGMRIVDAGRVDASNCQTLVCAVEEQVTGLSRDALIAYLAEHEIEAAPIRALDVSERNSAHIDRSWLRLPLGAHVGAREVERVCGVIRAAIEDSGLRGERQ